jgi:hypothetical protein
MVMRRDYSDANKELLHASGFGSLS